MTADEIDNLTIREVRAIAAQAGTALKQLRDVQSMFGVPVLPGGAPLHVPSVVDVNEAMVNAGMAYRQPPPPQQPYPCPGCGRTGPIVPGESAGPTECLQCGNPRPLVAGPNVRQTNKGPMVVDVEARNRLIGSPAFDANGEPA